MNYQLMNIKNTLVPAAALLLACSWSAQAALPVPETPLTTCQIATAGDEEDDTYLTAVVIELDKVFDSLYQDCINIYRKNCTDPQDLQQAHDTATVWAQELMPVSITYICDNDPAYACAVNLNRVHIPLQKPGKHHYRVRYDFQSGRGPFSAYADYDVTNIKGERNIIRVSRQDFDKWQREVLITFRLDPSLLKINPQLRTKGVAVLEEKEYPLNSRGEFKAKCRFEPEQDLDIDYRLTGLGNCFSARLRNFRATPFTRLMVIDRKSILD